MFIYVFQIGRLLPLISRAIVSACMPEISHAKADYNVVQNNGPGAGQLVPHAHFHIIPRYPDDCAERRTVWGTQGERQNRDDEEANQLVRIIRGNLRQEWQEKS